MLRLGYGWDRDWIRDRTDCNEWVEIEVDVEDGWKMEMGLADQKLFFNSQHLSIDMSFHPKYTSHSFLFTHSTLHE